VVLGDVWRVEPREDRNLLDDVVHFIFGVLDVNDFDRDRLSCSVVDAVGSQ